MCHKIKKMMISHNVNDMHASYLNISRWPVRFVDIFTVRSSTGGDLSSWPNMGLMWILLGLITERGSLELVVLGLR